MLFIRPHAQDLQLLQDIFEMFQGASGLKHNLDTCHMAPIRCTEEGIHLALNIYPCQRVEFPIRYLGIPLALGKLPKSALQPLVDKVVDKLPVWKGNFMNCSGRLALIKSTLTAIPIHTSISVGLPQWVIKSLIKIIKAFLWTGSNVVQGGKCLVAWGGVQRPLDLGGLGILDQNHFGMALRGRWLWLRRMDTSRDWGSLTIQEDQATTAFFQASLAVRLGDGTSLLFWLDP
jgi:hypothetical protein